jgi:hypothetical protein
MCVSAQIDVQLQNVNRLASRQHGSHIVLC